MRSYPERKKPKQGPKSYATWLLSRKDYSKTELEQKLIGRGYETQEAQEAVQWLIAHKFVDDKRLAGSMVRGLKHSASKQNIKNKIKASKAEINPEELNELLESEEVNDTEVLKRLIARKLQSKPEKLKDPKELEKLFRFLAYRGFKAYDIQKALKDYKVNIDLEV